MRRFGLPARSKRKGLSSLFSMGDERDKEVCQWKKYRQIKKAADFNTSKDDRAEIARKNQWEAWPPNINNGFYCFVGLLFLLPQQTKYECPKPGIKCQTDCFGTYAASKSQYVAALLSSFVVLYWHQEAIKPPASSPKKSVSLLSLYLLLLFFRSCCCFYWVSSACFCCCADTRAEPVPAFLIVA
ncbi:hypothetical protein [Ventosimonas gracilis]|uniref:hypothetical protein n=1 Tax=Ventosimonas gracilis TaxID=1680762 RepID=UPI0013966C76|nr:hypothetical protein [Ventosimonas gracilis]